MSAFKKGGFRGGDRGGKPHFKKSFGSKGGFTRGQGSFDGPRKIYTATCSDCGDSCEVPFRPTGERPVFCKDCFDKQSPQKFDRREAPRSFDRRDTPRFAPKPANNDRAIEELKAQIRSLAGKLDSVAALLSTVAASVEELKPAKKSLGDVVKKVVKDDAAKTVKKSAKKVVKVAAKKVAKSAAAKKVVTKKKAK